MSWGVTLRSARKGIAAPPRSPKTILPAPPEVLPAGSVLQRCCPFPLLFFLSSEKGESQEARLTLRAGAILDAAGEAIAPPVGATRGVGIAHHQRNRLPPMGATPFREPITGSGVTTGFISGNENCFTGLNPRLTYPHGFSSMPDHQGHISGGVRTFF
jgi:hypothetical protein